MEKIRTFRCGFVGFPYLIVQNQIERLGKNQNQETIESGKRNHDEKDIAMILKEKEKAGKVQ